ncbi:hypothetical protein TOTORO_00800 [Serratia phage vB_SmaS-Totoro]|nr:hypothetical protein TOTORO_00800 [Serratia phage vB_SmaS-Totoro]
MEFLVLVILFLLALAVFDKKGFSLVNFIVLDLLISRMLGALYALMFPGIFSRY